MIRGPQLEPELEEKHTLKDGVGRTNWSQNNFTDDSICKEKEWRELADAT